MNSIKSESTRSRKGRGAVSNTDSRYSEHRRETMDDGWLVNESADSRVPTIVHRDTSRTIVATNRSPDVPFDQSINPYRGCEHGCIYCFARPTHAYLDLSPGLDFETRLFYKPDAARLFLAALSRPGYRCRVIALGTNTDPYQPIERRFGVMRSILEVCAHTRHPIGITTKSSRIEKDLDLLQDLARDNLVSVSISVTTLDTTLARKLEPRASAPGRRLQAIERLAVAGIPVSVSVAPVIPVLTDPEMETIMAEAAARGAGSAGYILLRLPREVKDLFKEWLREHYPHRAGHIMSVIRQSRQGRENDAAFGRRRRGTGVFAELVAKRFRLAARRLELDGGPPGLNSQSFRRPGAQMGLDL
ncbi:MAG: PA0069 family radical SAM protein [Gammaproteobacteria bacterium]|nr:PA0069 family radical SAM protein [Gammaproteobacteria bacterium]